jgi:DNA-binding MarR family transcriptional regulator
MTFDKSNSAGYLANHMARLFALGLRQKIRLFGLAPAQFMTLLELWDEDGLTQKQLVNRLDVEQATMANTLARMQRDGLVLRKPHPSDKRAHSLFLTAKARAIEAAAKQAALGVNETAMADFSQGEREQFLVYMRRIISRLQSNVGK